MIIVEPDEARETADEVLARPEYQEEAPSLIDRAFNWLVEQLDEFLGVVVGGGGGRWIGLALLAVVLAAVVYLLWRLLPRELRLRRREPGLVVEQVATAAGRTRSEWLAEAAAAELAASWDRAVHARYHALIAGLADRGDLPAELSVTSGEHREVFISQAEARDPGTVAQFAGATDRFEQVWFGGWDASADDSHAMAEADRSLLGQGAG